MSDIRQGEITGVKNKADTDDRMKGDPFHPRAIWGYPTREAELAMFDNQPNKSENPARFHLS